MRADVIVVGLGSMGSATAHTLASRGVRVIGLDQFAPPHDRGAHAGESRIIRMAYMEGAEYVPLVRRSYELWRELEAATGDSLMTVTGGLMLGSETSLAVAGALATARAHDLPHEMLDAGDIRRRFPAFTPADGEVGLFEEAAGLIRPERAIGAHLRQAREYGADLRTGVAVEDWAAGPDGVSVRTPDGVIDADHLVLAPGAWAPGLTRIPVGLRVQRRVQHYWRASQPELFTIGRLPVWIWEYGPEQAAYGVPEVDGGVKAALHHGHETADAGRGASAVRQEEIASMRDWLAGHLPGLAEGAWVGGKPCLYTLTPDEHFVLGAHPMYANVSVACGFSGHGFKFTPVVGEILADLAMTGATQHPIDLFRPDRLETSPGSAGSDSP